VSVLYNRISARIRDGVAVAEARNGACTACFMALRPQVMSEVRRGDDIVTCDNCNRILYYAPAPEAAASKTPAAASTASEAAAS
jgi:predicted  nucleic acid-binding Zn-ribbon protein